MLLVGYVSVTFSTFYLTCYTVNATIALLSRKEATLTKSNTTATLKPSYREYVRSDFGLLKKYQQDSLSGSFVRLPYPYADKYKASCTVGYGRFPASAKSLGLSPQGRRS